ncbi:hypothetical protein, partial [Pseudomonas syringae]|uniref:hypothetical protein n=1 Tax=Pseudomonas syringae TaxID=317 RepID=UPI001967CE99
TLCVLSYSSDAAQSCDAEQFRADCAPILPVLIPALQCSHLFFSLFHHQYFQSIRAGNGHFIEL